MKQDKKENIRRAKKLFDDRRKAKLQGVEDRNNASATRSPEEQLKRLNSRFGKGEGAKKERRKLERKIQKSKKTS